MRGEQQKMPEAFVNLHNHSMYSILDGNQSVSDIVDRAIDLDQFAAAVTDHGSVGGLFALEQVCEGVVRQKERDRVKDDSRVAVEPIFGVESYVVGNMLDKSTKDRMHLTLLAENDIGLYNLIKISSCGWVKGFYYKPRIDLKLLKEYKEGLIVMGACMSGVVSTQLMNDDWDKAVNVCKWFLKNFGDEKFYLELMPLVPRKTEDGKKQKLMMDKINKGLVELSKELGIQVVATNDCHYSSSEGEKNQDILLCIQSKKKITDENRWQFSFSELYMKSREEMEESFNKYYPFLPEGLVNSALNNTALIAHGCTARFRRGKNWVPSFSSEEGFDDFKYLKNLVSKGWKEKITKERLKRVSKKLDVGEVELKGIYKDRVMRELEAIKDNGFINYFLIVWDMCNWAREHEILGGPGRGSSAGSLVSFLVGITHVDPIEYNLLFERFITPGRVTLPDIDTDFEDRRRDEVKNYLHERWGQDNVISIGTYGTLKGKQALKDVGRVFDVPWQETQKVCDVIIIRPNGDARFSYTLEDTLDQFEVAQKYDSCYPEIFGNASKLEGRIRQRGVHACGMLIASEPIIDILPIEQYKGNTITAFDWRETDAMGMLKLDVLGLQTLTIIKETLSRIKDATGEDIDIYKVNLEDEEVYRSYSEGNTIGVFQMDSIGFAKLAKDAGIDNFDDLIAVNTLYRPGGMRSGLSQLYVKRKNGKDYEKLHPIFDEVTEETYGCIIYQEQVMNILKYMSLLTAQQIDTARKYIGKSEGPSRMNKFRQAFYEGCLNNPKYMEGLTEEQKEEPLKIAEGIFNNLLHFGSYGFNKSHAASYAMISYWTMWLKVNYPLYFYSVLLSCEGDDNNTIKFIRDMRNNGTKLLPPDINKSSDWFIVEGDNIRAGLSKIKFVGERAVESIISSRPYKNFDDFLSKVDRRVVNKKVIINLIKVGAFSCWYNNRAELIARFEAINGKKNKSIDDVDISVEPWTEEEMIRNITSVYPVPTEKYITEYYDDVLDTCFRKIINTSEVEANKNKVVYMVGTVQDIKFNQVGDFDLKDRSDEEKENSDFGMRYANINLEDIHGYRRHKFSVDVYKKYGSILEKREGTPVLIKSRVDKTRDINYVLDIADLDDWRTRINDGLELTKFQKSLTINPLDDYDDVREAYCFPALEEAEGKTIKVMGEIIYLREYHAKNGLMLFVGIEDETGTLDIMIWPDGYEKFDKCLKLDNLVAISATKVKGDRYAVDCDNGGRVNLLSQLKKRLNDES